MPENNATFHYFKKSGKWYTSERGVYPDRAFRPFYLGAATAREVILEDNGNRSPGLSTTGSVFTCIVVPDEEKTHGWPLLLPIVEDDE